jgi:hypothetical protein
MKLYEQSVQVDFGLSSKDLLPKLAAAVSESIPSQAEPVRLAITHSDGNRMSVELGVLEGRVGKKPASIFQFARRLVENTREFNAVMLVPTGVGAAVGGHAGDAGPVSRLLASVCDNLITHPNVVNASDINEMTENTLYAEGSVIARLLMGAVGLQKVRSNRVLTIIEKHPTDPLFVNGAINSVNAARAAAGLNAGHVLILDNAQQLIAEHAPSGRAVGRVENLSHLFVQLEGMKDEFDCVAFSSIIKIPSRALHKQYFESKGEMINPWGGVEAIFTHAVSSILDVQSAHSPMIEDQLVSNMDVGIVDGRLAAEAISFTYMQCILKGLQKAPKLVTDPLAIAHPGVISAADISCLVIPIGCVGLPTLAALAQGITVIAVKENTNIMRNDLAILPWRPNQLIIVDTYLEALGAMAALKAGIAVDTLRRPFANAEIITDYSELSSTLKTSLSKSEVKSA